VRYDYHYVCEPNNISIRARNLPSNSKGIRVTFFINNNEAFHIDNILGTYIPTREDVDAHVKKCCIFIKQTSEEYIQKRYGSEKIAHILNIHRSLKRVRKKIGTTIWKE